MKSLVLISSYPKSGNTWLRIFLENIIKKRFVGINELSSVPSASGRSLLENYSDYELSSLTEKEILNLRSKIYQYISESSSEIMYLKVHDYYSYLASGDALFPKDSIKAVVYLVRNPLDIAVSFANHSGMSIDKIIDKMNNENYSLNGNDIRIDNQVKQFLSSWSRHVESWINEKELNIRVVKYEDLKKSTVKVFREILNFLEIEYREDDFKSAINDTSFEKLKEQENEIGFNEKAAGVKNFFWKGEVGTWKKFLTNEQKEKIINCHKKVMEQFGYLSIK